MQIQAPQPLSAITETNKYRFITTFTSASALLITVAAFTTPTAQADIISRTADFENIEPGEDPQQGWTLGVADEFVDFLPNGNHFLHGEIDNWGVTLHSKRNGTNPWVGDKDYRSEGVVGFELTVAAIAQFPTARKLTIFLMDDNGTPNDVADDFGFYHTINQWYFFQANPRTYQFLIPSWETGDTPPDGWFPYAVNGEIPPDISWDQVITNVDRLDVGFWRPDFFYIFQTHEFAIDNVRIYVDTDLRQ